jgi:hypothetical protein
MKMPSCIERPFVIAESEFVGAHGSVPFFLLTSIFIPGRFCVYLFSIHTYSKIVMKISGLKIVLFFFLSVVTFGCGSSGTDAGSLSTKNFSASSSEFTVLAGDSSVTIRFSLLAEPFGNTSDTSIAVIQIQPVTGFTFAYDSSHTSDPRCTIHNCPGLVKRGDWSDFTFSADKSLIGNTFSIRVYLFAQPDSVDTLTLTVHVTGTRAITISDSTFASGWSSILLFDTTKTGVYIQSDGQIPLGGKLGPFLRTCISWQGGPDRSKAIVAEVFWTTFYHPQNDGPVLSISYKWDRRDSTLNSFRTAPAVSLLLQQNNEFYIGTLHYGAGTNWKHESGTNLQASYFTEIAGNHPGSHPDFSAGALAMNFGYAITTPVNSADEQNTTFVSVDNWSVTINR